MKNIQDHFYNDEKEKDFLKYLGERDNAFWESLSYLNHLNEANYENEDISFYHARYFITGRLINHIMSAYQMLKMGLEDDCLVMYRQCLETSWLLNFFIKNPSKADAWVKEKKPYSEIEPWERREALDNKSHAKKIYRHLSNVVHTNHKSIWGFAIGGTFDKWIVDKHFSSLLKLINECISYFIELMELYDTDILKLGLTELHEEVTQKLWLSLYISSYLTYPEETIALLVNNGEEQTLKYIQSKYEFV